MVYWLFMIVLKVSDLMHKLKQLFNKYCVYKGYVVIHQSDCLDTFIEFNGYRDLYCVYKHYVPRGSDVTVYADVSSEVGNYLFLYLLLLLVIIGILLSY